MLPLVLGGFRLLAASPIAADDDAKGVVAEKKGALDEALGDFDRAIRLRPKDPNFYYNRGMVRRAKGAEDAAQADFQKARELDPSDAEGYGHLGEPNASDVDGQLIQFSQALELNPTSGDLYSNRGRAKEEKADLTGAIADFRRAEILAPSNTFFSDELGVLEFCLSNWHAAEEQWRRTVTQGDDDACFGIWMAEMEGAREGKRAAFSREQKRADLELSRFIAGRHKADWVADVGNFLVGKIDEEEFVKRANISSDPKIRTACAWETLFFMGAREFFGGDKEHAAEKFRECVQEGPSDTDEVRVSKEELKRMAPPEKK